MTWFKCNGIRIRQDSIVAYSKHEKLEGDSALVWLFGGDGNSFFEFPAKRGGEELLKYLDDHFGTKDSIVEIA